jgi:hypothetical protein
VYCFELCSFGIFFGESHEVSETEDVVCSSIYTESYTLQFVDLLLHVSLSLSMDKFVIHLVLIYLEVSESKPFPHVRKFRIWMAVHV